MIAQVAKSRADLQIANYGVIQRKVSIRAGKVLFQDNAEAVRCRPRHAHNKFLLGVLCQAQNVVEGIGIGMRLVKKLDMAKQIGRINRLIELQFNRYVAGIDGDYLTVGKRQ